MLDEAQLDPAEGRGPVGPEGLPEDSPAVRMDAAREVHREAAEILGIERGEERPVPGIQVPGEAGPEERVHHRPDPMEGWKLLLEWALPVQGVSGDPHADGDVEVDRSVSADV